MSTQAFSGADGRNGDLTQARLTVANVSKAFPGVQALDNVSFAVSPGEVHALVGENGAGKSTLMRLVAGVETPDSGTLLLDGTPLQHVDEHIASALGIGMVHQELSLVSGLSVAENVFAARQPTNRVGGIDWSMLHRNTRALLKTLKTDIDPAARVGDLSPAQQQMVEIAKALSFDLRVLILDEPTAMLTINEVEHLFDVIRLLASQGVAIIYISHRLAEVFAIADRVTVLKDGRVTGVRSVGGIDENELMRLMVGRDLLFTRDEQRAPVDAPVLLRVVGIAAAPVVLDASLQVRAGEIVCLAGLVGAGRTELCEAIFGLRPRQAGVIAVNGVSTDLRSPSDARAVGIGMVPEDRKEAGLFLDMNITENIISTNLDLVSNGPLISRSKSEQLAGDYVGKLAIATPTTRQRVINLSGGNQQKVLLAKWLAHGPRVLIVDEPTRGVDVGAKAEIYAVLRALAASGMALLIVSSDLPEVLTLAHRIVVMASGRTVGEIDGRVADEMSILQLASPAAIGGNAV